MSLSKANKQNTKSNNLKRPSFLVFLAWWCIWTPFHVALLRHFNTSDVAAITDAVLGTFFLAVICSFVINNMRYYLPKKERYFYVFITSMALSAIWLLVTQLVLQMIFKDDTVYLQALKNTGIIRYTIAFLIIACNTLIGLLWYSQLQQRKENERRADTEKLARDAELNKLRQQLQPHFLFNSLNSISALTGQQPEKARHMIQQLSDFLRGTLRNEAQQWISLKEELEYLQLYLDIEKVRFGYRLQSQIRCNETALSLTLPAMLLQPLVENAIKFGLYDTIGEVNIIINAEVNAGMLRIMVQNPYDASTAMPVKGTGFGLASVKRRLFLLFGRQDLLQIQKENELFIATLDIPQLV